MFGSVVGFSILILNGDELDKLCESEPIALAHTLLALESASTLERLFLNQFFKKDFV